MKKAIFIIAALAVVAVVFPAKSFAGTSGSIAADCAFLLETPDDSSTFSAVYNIDMREVLALSGDGVKFVSYLITSDFPCFNKAANSAKLISAENFFTAGISRSKYSVKLE
ncbi:hypothetical protein KJ633_06930, partial [bacterium]|nr:hypothetical protein [bacterium]MBU3956180.1 hypothetical protein [bacterium]